MKYAGGLVKHLGLQMYAGAVSAIAELVANAWDADAQNVWIDVPLDIPISEDSEIRVRDDGVGMTFEEADDFYLVVGRDRRATGSYTTGGRKAMGRKGLGKFAGFGAAHLVEVWTVKGGRLTGFGMDYQDIVRGGAAQFVESYKPAVLADHPVRKRDPIQTGTVVILKRLQLRKAINASQFRASMTRRFAVFSDTFRVHVNGDPLRREELAFQFRFPEEGKTPEDIPGTGHIEWWAGFTREPIPDEEARGISVLARGKLAQTPFFFDLSGGAYGQHGMQYLTGEVEADSLDEAVDLIATDRGSVLWEDPQARPVLEWGQQKVKELLRTWASKRQEEHIKKLRDTTPYLQRLERFPDRERKELEAAINRLASIETIEDDRLGELVEFLIRAYENETFMQLIKALNAADEGAQQEIFRLVEEWDVLEAIAVAQVVRGRIEVVRKFGTLIKAKAPEKPDMQDFVKEHPWLLDPKWDLLQHERSLDKVLAEQFGSKGKEATGKRRLDFFCLSDSLLAVVVEVKRPGDLIGRDELAQLEDYVDYLRTWQAQNSDPDRHYIIRGSLIYSRMRADAKEKARRLMDDGIHVLTWEKLLADAERLHHEFLDLVKSRAPQDDPRITRLDALERET